MIQKIYPRDIIALVSLIFCFILIALGINHVVSGIAIMIITYYFSKRVYEERNPNGNLNEKVQKLEEEIKQIPQSPQIPSSPHAPAFEPGRVVVKPVISA